VASVFVSLSMAIPAFWLGMLLILLLAVQYRWFPPSGYVDPLRDPLNSFHHLFLPAVTLGLSFAGRLSLFVKAALLDVLSDDYIRTARAKGLPERLVLTRHALNALIPIITVLGIYLGQFLGGAVVIEVVFEWPGLGRLIMGAIGNRDYPIVMGSILSIVVVFVLVNFLVELSYAVVDPRIRLEAEEE
jgi:peptide/nickel transport system permease protein